MTQHYYCIGFLLPSETENDCIRLGSELSNAFRKKDGKESQSFFLNKLKDRLPMIKVKWNFTATDTEIEEVKKVIKDFTKTQSMVNIQITGVKVFDEEKIALIVKDQKCEEDSSRRNIDNLMSLKTALCVELARLKLNRKINNKNEPVFIPRITIGIYPKSGINSVVSILNYVPGIKSFQKISLENLVLFKKESENHEWEAVSTYSLNGNVFV